MGEAISHQNIEGVTHKESLLCPYPVEDTATFQKAAPSVRAFLRNASDHVGVMTAVLREKGLTRTPEETVDYIGDLASGVSLNDVTVGVADLEGRTYNPKYGQLAQLLGVRIPHNKDVRTVQRNYGTLAHSAVTRLLLMSAPAAPRNQLPLWQNPDDFPSSQLSPEYLDPLREQWQKLNKGYDQILNWESECGEFARGVDTLIPLLKSVYGSNLDPILFYQDPFGDSFRPVVLMSLAAAALHLEIRYMKRELNVCRPQEMGLRAGRVDGVSAISLNEYQGLEEDDLNVVRSVGGMAHKTLGSLVWDMATITDGRIGILAEDLKFEIGDMLGYRLNGHPPLTVAELKRPLTRHLHQGDRYVALGSIDAVSSWREGQQLSPRVAGMRFSYIGPSEVKEFVINPDNDRMEEVIGDEFARRWPDAVERARVRRLENVVLGHMIDLTRLMKDSDRIHQPVTTGLQKAQEIPVPLFVQVMADIQDRRRGKDYVRVVGQRPNGEPNYRFDFTRCAELGLVPPGYEFDQRITVPCLVADRHHDGGVDLHPSASVYPNGTYHCFACGSDGAFDRRKLPAGIVLQESRRYRGDHFPSKVVARESFVNWEYVPKLDEILGFIQKVAQFHFSRGEVPKEYLRSRGLDPDLAEEFEVGFTTDQLWRTVLENYKYAELVYAGVINHSPRRTEKNERLMRHLLAQGVRLEEMVIKMQPKTGGPSVDGYPYPILGSDARAGKGPGNRITFPLRLKIDDQWRITSLYGRAARIVKKEDYEIKAHVKTVIKGRHGIDQGGLGLEVLDYPEVEGIWETEAVLDNWALRQVLGRKNVISIIGTGNDNIVGELVRAGKVISAAHDRDGGGQGATRRLAKLLRHYGFKKPIYDFTAAAVALNPWLLEERFQGAKDWNDFWQLHLKGEKFIMPEGWGIPVPEEEEKKRIK